MCRNEIKQKLQIGFYSSILRYHPEIGSLRKSRSYSALAPTNAMEYKWIRKYFKIVIDMHCRDRRVEPGMRPFLSYKPKQNEWKNQMEKVHHTPPAKGKITSSSASLPPLPPVGTNWMHVLYDLFVFFLSDSSTSISCLCRFDTFWEFCHVLEWSSQRTWIYATIPFRAPPVKN